MPSARKTICIAAALALAALTPAPALADGGAVSEDHEFYAPQAPKEYPLAIETRVTKATPPPPVVIKVEVPSSSSAVSIHIDTSIIDGRFMGFSSAKGTVKNLPESTAAISAAVDSVVDGASGKGKALDYLAVSLTGDRTVELSEEPGAGGIVIGRLEPGGECDLTAEVEDRTGGSPIPPGEYGMQATIKIHAV